MKYITTGVVLAALIGLFYFSACDESEPSKAILNLSWVEDESSIALLNQGKVVWKLNYDRNEDKPYFSPLRTLNGIDLVLERPDDHPWHRGLWFSWKYINGINYWE